MRFLLATIALQTSLVASAQNLISVPMVGQPLMNTRAGQTVGCGIRVLGVHDGGNSRRVFDVSLNVFEQGVGMAKLTARTGKLTDTFDQMKVQTLHTGWFRAPGFAPAAPTGPISPGESPGSRLLRTDLSATMDFLTSVIEGKEVRIGLGWEKGQEVIYYGKIELSLDDKKQYARCIDDLIQAIDKQTPTKK